MPAGLKMPARVLRTSSTDHVAQRESHGTILALCAATVVLSAALEVRPPETVYVRGFEGRPFPPICSLRRLTGYPCPGCGMTRSFISMARLDLAAAVHYHPLGPILFLVALTQVPYRLWRLRGAARGGTAATRPPAQDRPAAAPSRMRPSVAWQRCRAWCIGLFAVAMIAAWVYRLAAVAAGGPLDSRGHTTHDGRATLETCPFPPYNSSLVHGRDRVSAVRTTDSSLPGPSR